MDLRAKCYILCFNKFCWDLINSWWFVTFNFSTAISYLKTLDSATTRSAVRVSICLT